MSELGGIEQTYRMFRAHVKLGSTRTAGPWRPTQAEAEADLATARGAESREAFAESLASLSRQPQDIVTLEYLASLSRPPQDTATVPPEGGQASASAAATQPALNREPAWRGGDAEPALQEASSATPADAGAEIPTLANATEHTPYRNLFSEAAPAVREALRLARAEAADPRAVSEEAWDAAWLGACEAWDAAIADGSYKQQKKRRKLCSEHGFTCPRVLDKDTQGGATLEHARRQLEEKASAAVLAVRALFP